MKYKYLALALCIFCAAFSGCTRFDTDVNEQISAPLQDEGQETNTQDTADLHKISAEVPLTVSPLASEAFLEPQDSFSWDREYPPEYVMLHFTSAVVISRNDPYNMNTVRGIFEDSEISIHYIIDRDGSVYCYMPEDRAAWHAGRGTFGDDDKLTDSMNKYSIGIEILAIGSREDMAQYLTDAEYASLSPELIGYTDAQYETLKVLLKDICDRNDIPFDREHIIGHDEYNPQKNDPGELFLWEKIFQ